MIITETEHTFKRVEVQLRSAEHFSPYSIDRNLLTKKSKETKKQTNPITIIIKSEEVIEYAFSAIFLHGLMRHNIY